MDTATPLVVAALGFALGYYLQPQWLPWPLNQGVHTAYVEAHARAL